MKNILKILILIFLLNSCTEEEKTEIEKKDIRVLILGNSILKHGPNNEIGWNYDWGMAATSPDKDFLHVYNKLMQTSNKYNYVDIYSKNIASWENDFSYNLNEYVDISTLTYDILIVRLGENVTNTFEYYNALHTMINFFKTQNTKVILTGIIWENSIKENIHRQLSLDYGYDYISFEDFRNDSQNFSWNMFNNGAVSAHPSNQGMQNIAELLFNASIKLNYK